MALGKLVLRAAYAVLMAAVFWLPAGCGGGDPHTGPLGGTGGIGGIGGGGGSGTPRCGDGVIGEGEDCDDGNTTSGDRCPADCKALCGDGVVQGAESCDDANDVPGDGCTRCRGAGELYWRDWLDPQLCAGQMVRGRNDTIIVLCDRATGLFRRYALDGTVVETYPN